MKNTITIHNLQDGSVLVEVYWGNVCLTPVSAEEIAAAGKQQALIEAVKSAMISLGMSRKARRTALKWAGYFHDQA